MSIEDELVEEYWKTHNNRFINSPYFLAKDQSISIKKLEKYIEDTAYLKIFTNCIYCKTKIETIASNQLYAGLVMSHGTVCHFCDRPLIASQIQNKLLSGKKSPSISSKPKLFPTGTICMDEDLILKAKIPYTFMIRTKSNGKVIITLETKDKQLTLKLNTNENIRN